MASNHLTPTYCSPTGHDGTDHLTLPAVPLAVHTVTVETILWYKCNNHPSTSAENVGY
jgi:hypothetical protein